MNNTGPAWCRPCRAANDDADLILVSAAKFLYHTHAYGKNVSNLFVPERERG
jgi:hypothetical protein